METEPNVTFCVVPDNSIIYVPPPPPTHGGRSNIRYRQESALETLKPGPNIREGRRGKLPSQLPLSPPEVLGPSLFLRKPFLRQNKDEGGGGGGRWPAITGFLTVADLLMSSFFWYLAFLCFCDSWKTTIILRTSSPHYGNHWLKYNIVKYRSVNLCSSVADPGCLSRIRDVYPGSRIRIFPSRIQGQKPHKRIQVFLTQKLF